MMRDLVATTGNARVDAIVKAIISIYEAAFPERIRGYYLVGSYGDDTAIDSSDLDMEILFKGALSQDERERCQTLKAACRTLCPIHLDLPVKAEATLRQVDTVDLKLRSKWVYGEDVRQMIPLPEMPLYLQQISTPTQRGLTMRFRQEVVSLPLAYPLPDDDYYGYMPQRYEDDQAPIKLWVLHVGWLATFLLVHHARVHVPSKRDLLPLYRQYIHDEWEGLINDVYLFGRGRWQYQWPDDETGRDMLKLLCRHTLAFENYVAGVYVAYLQEELADVNPALATERLAALGL